MNWQRGFTSLHPVMDEGKIRVCLVQVGSNQAIGCVDGEQVGSGR
jgi:hypothetical protein